MNYIKIFINDHEISVENNGKVYFCIKEKINGFREFL